MKTAGAEVLEDPGLTPSSPCTPREGVSAGSPQLRLRGAGIWGKGWSKSFGVHLPLVLITPDFGLSAWLSFVWELFRLRGLLA